MGGGAPILNEELFQFFNDDGDEAGSTSRGSIGADVSANVDENIRLRFSISNTGTMDANNLTIQLQAQLDGGGYQNVDASSTIAQMVATANLTEGNDCTERLAGAQTFDTTNGGQEDNDGVTASNTLAQNEEIEVDFNFQIISTDVADGNVVDFRVVQGDLTIMDNYNSGVPSVTVIEVGGFEFLPLFKREINVSLRM